MGLCIAFEHHDDEQTGHTPRFAAYAGTLIRIRDAYCFLTAGHILREVEQALQSDNVDIKSAVLADTFGRGRFKDHPIPFDLKSASIFYIDDDDEGLDFGVMLLQPYYIRLLATNGIVALEEKNWAHQASVRFDGYAMLGLPEEYTSAFVSASGDGVVSPTMFAVQRVAPPLAGGRSTKFERFVAQVDPAIGLKSIKGMSGGPIFGFNLEERHPRYWVVALQSAWSPARGLVFGCPLPILASLMTAWSGEATLSA
ncbi:hypothetical protein [Hyphomicrobium sp. 1Nfss2.1]|uniref:hypothetical protein n=1 Tax=Hyphomicrobium sp. 1Nfss2.1 TaxID=3413936 RepID=UPI003C7E0565